MIGLLSGLVLAAAAASPQPSAGVGWSLAQPADWSPEERATLDQLAASLPDGLRDVGRPVSILRGSSGPAAPGEPVRIRYRPGAAEIEIAEGEAVGPALVHGLAHVADRGHGWSREPAWRSLSQWRQRLGFWLSPERDPWAFALPRGMQNPAEDLATLAEAGFAGPLTNPDRHPACRMPSKWRFLSDRVGEAVDSPRCVDLQTAGLDPARVEQVEIVYVAATGAAAASVSGHVLIALRFHPDDQGIVRRDSYGMVADTTGVAEGSLAYAWRGITGGFRARVVREPFTTTTLRYSQFEDRSLHRFGLRLTEAEKVQVLQRLDEILQGWDRPYLFVSRNCTELVVELVNSFTPLRAPAPLSPDVLMALLDRKGLLEPIAAERPEEESLGERALRAREAREAEIAAILSRRPSLAAPMRGLDAPEGAVRAGAYSVLAEAAAADPSLSGPVARLLAWSDILEQSAMIDAEGRVTAEQAAGVDGLRRALARLRSVDPTAGPAAARDVQNRELHRQLDVQQRAVSTHTAYRPLQIDSALRVSEAGWVPWLSVATPLYDGRPGGGRRFGLSPGMAVTVLDGELQVAVDRLGWLRGRFNLLQASHVNLARRGPPLGWHLDLADLRYAREGQRRSEARWAEAGGLLGLLQSDDMRHHLVLYAGVAARSWTRTRPASGLSALWVPAERLGQGVGLGLPVGLRGQLQAAGRPLSNLRLDATWTPVLDLQARWHPEAAGQLQGQLRLGRMGRWDGALRLSAAGRVQELGLSKGVPSYRNPELELRAGLYFERW